MALLAMEPGRVDTLAMELQRVRPKTDELGLLVDLAVALSELRITSMNRLHEIGARCESVGRQLVERADIMEEEIEAPDTAGTITIKRGDTLTGLARIHGTTVAAIVAANESITDPDIIFAGDTIVIPGLPSDSAPTPPTPRSPGGDAQGGEGGDGPAEGGEDTAPGGEETGPQTGLTVEDFRAVAVELGVEVAAIRAVAEVEAAGDGFLPSGRPKILFEGAQFARLTEGVFSASHPHLSHSYGQSRDHYLGGEAEHDRLDEAKTLDSNAALQSASWGRFQIMGFNYAAAGYDSVEAYAEAMSLSEANHLGAFASFIAADINLHRALQNLDWETFALGYNGPDQASNNYAAKMAEAYERIKAMGE